MVVLPHFIDNVLVMATASSQRRCALPRMLMVMDCPSDFNRPVDASLECDVWPCKSCGAGWLKRLPPPLVTVLCPRLSPSRM